MTAVWVLRELWTRRLLVAVGLAAAIALAVMLTYRIEIGLPRTSPRRIP